MSLVTPTTKDVSDSLIASLEASLGQTIPFLPKSFLRVLSKAIAGVFILLYKYTGFMFLQMFPQTASFSETDVNGETVVPLILWGRLVGVGDPASATSAQLTIDITVTNQVGTLPAGSQLVGATNGVTYLTAIDVLLNAATVAVDILAVADQAGGNGSGIIGNLDNGSIVTFANPLANVGPNTVVTATVVTGADGETEAAYRQRVVDEFAKRAQGGALVDYELWGEEPAGILNLYPYTGALPGHVDVYSESATEPDGIPSPAQLVLVKESIELDSLGLASRRPVGAFVNSFPIVRTAFDVRVIDLIVENPAAVQADIQSAVEDFFLDAAPFIDGVSVSPREDRLTASELNGIIQDIVGANEGIYGNAIMSILGVDLSLYNLGIGEKSKLDGAVSFV